MWITKKDVTNNNQREYGMMEFILSPSNFNAAYLLVLRNKGAGGVDKMQVETLKAYLVEHKDELITSILKGTYRPKAVRRVRNTQRKREEVPVGHILSLLQSKLTGHSIDSDTAL